MGKMLLPGKPYKLKTIVVGNSSNGDTLSNCDFLDGAGIIAAKTLFSTSALSGTIYIKKGTYTLPSDLIFNDNAIKYQCLEGESRDSVNIIGSIKFNESLAQNFYNYYEIKNLSINGDIDGNSANMKSYVTIKNIRLTPAFASAGIKVGWAGIFQFHDSIIENCQLGIEKTNNVGQDPFEISRCYIIGWTGLKADTFVLPDETTMINENVFHVAQVDTQCLRIKANRARIQNNALRNIGGGALGRSLLLLGGTKNIISGNRCVGTLETDASTSDCVITSNNLSGGIYTLAGTGHSFANNL